MNNISWDKIQKQSNEILSDGLFKLKNRPIYNQNTNIDCDYGNYLITLDNKSFYIGEAKELNKRIKQQTRVTTSTFFKNFQKFQQNNQLIKPENIDQFKFQIISTKIGRKEIEEFGIVNLPTKLNNFQLDKRKKFLIADYNGLWDNVQQFSFDLLKEGEEIILQNKFIPWTDTKLIANAGLYLVRDSTDNLIYVGESSNIWERIITHSGQTYFSALRRHVGTEILKFILEERKGKKRYFSTTEDKVVSDFIKSCKLSIHPINFGRYEIEEHLIRKYKPLLNRKDNKHTE